MSSKILVVDDYRLARMMLISALQKLNFRKIIEASNGLEAHKELLAAVESDPFDLIFCDWNMPIMTGVELLQKVKQNPSLAATPFIMVTVESEAQAVERALALGAHDYLVKPFSLPVLEMKIRNALSRLNLPGTTSPAQKA